MRRLRWVVTVAGLLVAAVGLLDWWVFSSLARIVEDGERPPALGLVATLTGGAGALLATRRPPLSGALLGAAGLMALVAGALGYQTQLVYGPCWLILATLVVLERRPAPDEPDPPDGPLNA